LGALLDEIEAKYRVDKDRIYVTGLSMGGSGTWRLAAEFPDRFAAIAPFCGGANVTEASRIAHLPTWAFHGDQDKPVPVDYTLRMIEALKKAGGHPRMTIYPGVGHVCWEEAYGGQEFYDWLLAQRRGTPKHPPASSP
jgi:predicted peptidase